MNTTENRKAMEMGKRSGVTAAKGFAAGGLSCGVKKTGAKDLAIIMADRPAVAWGVFTRNSIKGAPVTWSRECLRSHNVRAIVANSGNSNVLTRDGYEHARRMARAVAEKLGVGERQVFVASTGVIGQPLPIEKIENGIGELFPRLSSQGGADAAEAIMTTDLTPKEASSTFDIGGGRVTVGGCAKGSGMIGPSMATMLAFVTTDAALSKLAVKDLTKRACDASFNSITVDGDTSTSDMLIVMASGATNAPLIEKPSGKRYSLLLDKTTEICEFLAKEIVRDGEGATKFVTVNVTGAASEKAAKLVAMSIAKSPLVKTALFGQDANWGRILCAAGYSGVPVDASRATLRISGVPIFSRGSLVSDDWEVAAAPKLKEKNVEITLDLGLGKASARVWTCDFSYDYVKINAAYRT